MPYLDKSSTKMLMALYNQSSMTADELTAAMGTLGIDSISETISALKSDGLIKTISIGGKKDGYGSKIDGITAYRITLSGRAYIEQRRRDRFLFWIPYIITTLIALAALVVAIVDLLAPCS